MTATSAATIPTQIGGNVANQYSGDAVSTKTIDEAQYHTAPTQLFPRTVQEEIYSTREFIPNSNGDERNLTNTATAFATPGYSELFQMRMQASIQRMMDDAAANKRTTISLPTTDYGDFSLKSKKEYFSVDAPTLQAFKSSQALREAGITVLGMPSKEARFELVAYDQTGRPISGSAWNDFFDTYSEIVAQEQAQASETLLG